MEGGNSVPLVVMGLIGHTRYMQPSLRKNWTPIIARCWLKFGSQLSKRLLVVGLLTIDPISGATAQSMHSEQEQRKVSITAVIKEAAAKAFNYDPHLIEVRLNDRRLVIPNCASPFQVTFPFRDRVTTQIDCTNPPWRGFVQVKLKEGVAIFAYRSYLTKGTLLKRSDVARRFHSAKSGEGSLVVVLGDVLDKPLTIDVAAGQPLLEAHFGIKITKENDSSEKHNKIAWIANKIIPRGTRLYEEAFTEDIIFGRAPTDLIKMDVNFELLEATRNIMPGDILRQSAVKLAPAVRKGQEIQVTIQKGSLKVTSLVTVSRDAALGEILEVFNTESGRPLQARVIGIGELELL